MLLCVLLSFPLFFFNDTATTEIYTLSLHDALPIFGDAVRALKALATHVETAVDKRGLERSEEHTSELQSQSNIVCRLLLEKKKSTLMSVSFSDGVSTQSPPFILNCCLQALAITNFP